MWVLISTDLCELKDIQIFRQLVPALSPCHPVLSILFCHTSPLCVLRYYIYESSLHVSKPSQPFLTNFVSKIINLICPSHHKHHIYCCSLIATSVPSTATCTSVPEHHFSIPQASFPNPLHFLY